MNKDIKNILDKDGVVLCKDAISEDIMKDVHKEYNSVEDSLENEEIFKDKPLIVFWKHVEGAKKKIATFDQMPKLWNLINMHIVPFLRNSLQERATRLQLLETIVFNKPPMISNTLNWHQDVSYFPMKPNNQIAVWIPFEYVNEKRGAMVYALKSHKEGMMGSTNLHTREKFDNEDRPIIPDNPEEHGFEVKRMDMSCKDILIHDGYTWHYSLPNIEEGYTRKGLSVRFITDEAVFDPRPGQGAAFTKQIQIDSGEIIQGEPFPIL